MKPVTLAAFINDQKRLWAYCRDCQHNKFLDPCDIPLPGSYPVPKIDGRIKCSACGSRNVHSKPAWFMGRTMSKEGDDSSDWITFIFCIVLFFTLSYFVERKYEPDNAFEFAIGYFLYPGELVTGRDDLYPCFVGRIYALLEGRSAPEAENACAARQLKTETLRKLVERLELGTDNVFRQELMRRTRKDTKRRPAP